MFTGFEEYDGKREFYSAEFQLTESKIMYQFKLRRSESEPLFAVVKEGSQALENIKEGDVINMQFHYLDKTIPAELKQTRIKYIIKDGTNGFKGHYMVGLALDWAENKEIAA